MRLVSFLRGEGWRFQRFDDDVITGIKRFTFYAHVLVIRSYNEAAAWRAPLGAEFDPYDPPHVMWSYEGSATHTLRAALTLTLPDAYLFQGPTPANCRVPAHERAHPTPLSDPLTPGTTEP